MKKIKSVLCLLLILSVLFLSGCSKDTKSQILDSLEKQENLSAKSRDTSIFTETGTVKTLKRISRSDMTVLYFDEKNMSICVYDYASKKLWKALPESYTDETPCVLSVDILVGAQQYTLNSQTDSVLKNKAVYEIKEDSVTVNYTFETSLKDGTVISFCVPVCFAASDGVMSASIDCSKIDTSSLPEYVKVKTVHLLNYFGSSTSGEDGDYIFIPDGCGAVIDTSEKADEFKTVTIPVYGADYASAEEDTSAYARVAAFGMKSGESAFAALIENGEAISKISASKALKKSSYNKVGASFDLIKTYNDGENAYASSSAYDGEIRITYKLISGDSASYVGMAAACREVLIRNGTLGMQELQKESSSFPVVLTLIGSAQTGEKGKAQTLTDFEQAQEIITFFRSKGLSNIVLRLRGIFDGQTVQTDISKLNINSSLGSKNELRDFISFTDSQNISVFADVNLITSQKGEIKNAALSLSGKNIGQSFTDIKNSVISSSTEREFVSFSQIEDNTNALIAKFKTYDFEGVCISDAGKMLVSDYASKTGANRQQYKSAVFSAGAGISSSKNIMVDGGNIYTVKYADYVVNLPTYASVKGRDYCTSVPFLQSLLHGVAAYSSTPMNLNSNTDTALLKAAEYGCIPNFEMYYSDNSTEEKQDSYHYMNCGTTAQSAYERLANTFSSLQNKKITAHYLVKKGVYCTEYSGNISVYVNYNKKDVTVNGVKVEARSFLKVG